MKNILYLSIYMIRSSLLAFPAITSETSSHCWLHTLACAYTPRFFSQDPQISSQEPHMYIKHIRAHVCVYTPYMHTHICLYIYTYMYICKKIYLWSRNTFSCNMYTNMMAHINIYHLPCVYSSRLSAHDSQISATGPYM